MTKIKFSLSPSSINLYKYSQLLFYYAYILKAPPDTRTVECYGKAGNLCHDMLEHHDKIKNLEIEFGNNWNDRDLNVLLGFNGKPLKKEVYLQAMKNGLKLLKEKYKIERAEESIEWPLYEDDKFDIKVKGIIDVQAVKLKDSKKVIMDYKTSSKKDSGEGFELQGKHYCLLVYKKYKYIPEEVIFEYIKIDKDSTFKFTEDDLIEYEKEISRICREIVTKGTDIEKYEVGEIDSPFNTHLKKCLAEEERRNNKDLIQAILKDNFLYFKNIPKLLSDSMKIKYSYYVPGYSFSELFKKRLWDGKKYLFKKNTLPYAFVNDFQQLLLDFNKHYNKEYKFIILDERNEKIINKKYKTEFRKSDIKLRYYQNDAIKAAIDKKIGILYIGTGGGKSLVSAELIKILNRRTLFLVNRVELSRQTKEVFEDYLGVECGEMTEGKIVTNYQVTIASIQTLAAILKRNDETSKQLQLFLYNVTFLLSDEAQNISDEGMYGTISSQLKNLVYSISLSGSPWRNE